MAAREIEILGCKIFVCPNLSLLDEKGKELGLKERTIKKAKDIAIMYFKKTYHMPHYSSVRCLLPSFIYIASIVEGEKKTQTKVADVFGVSHSTITKWYNGIIYTLGMIIPEEVRKSKISRRPDMIGMFAYEIEKEGKALQLNEETIEKAKNLVIKYSEKAPNYRYYSHIKQLSPAFVYMASVIENDRRTQIEVSMVSGVAESFISKWYRNILRVLGMKIISNNMHVIAVLEGQDD